MTLKPVAERFVCGGWDSKTQHSACEVNALTGCATAAAILVQFILVAVAFLKHLIINYTCMYTIDVIIMF